MMPPGRSSEWKMRNRSNVSHGLNRWS